MRYVLQNRLVWKLKENKKSYSHIACLALGSNIQPVYYLPLAIQLLKCYVKVRSISTAWETEAIGTEGLNFINACVQVITDLSYKKLKFKVARKIEAQLGRLRTTDKYASRTMDIDIVIYDDKVISPLLWNQAYLAVPCSEIYPDLKNDQTGDSLKEIALRIRRSVYIRKYPNFFVNLPAKLNCE